MADYAISSANLSAIESGLRAINNNLGTLNDNLEVIDNNVDRVNDNVKVVYDEVGALARDFHNFVQIQIRANALSKAQQRVIQIRQEMEKRFGHYDIVRRTTTGILQADDIGIVKKRHYQQRYRGTYDFHSRLLVGSLFGSTCCLD